MIDFKTDILEVPVETKINAINKFIMSHNFSRFCTDEITDLSYVLSTNYTYIDTSRRAGSSISDFIRNYSMELNPDTFWINLCTDKDLTHEKVRYMYM